MQGVDPLVETAVHLVPVKVQTDLGVRLHGSLLQQLDVLCQIVMRIPARLIRNGLVAAPALPFHLFLAVLAIRRVGRGVVCPFNDVNVGDAFFILRQDADDPVVRPERVHHGAGIRFMSADVKDPRIRIPGKFQFVAAERQTGIDQRLLSLGLHHVITLGNVSAGHFSRVNAVDDDVVLIINERHESEGIDSLHDLAFLDAPFDQPPGLRGEPDVEEAVLLVSRPRGQSGLRL